MMAFQEFHNALRIMYSIDRAEMLSAGIPIEEWSHFMADPYAWFIHADDGHAQAMFALIQERQPKHPEMLQGSVQKFSFQERVWNWVKECFGSAVGRNRAIRNYRFLEEAIELVQALDCSESNAHLLVAYVYTRPKGEPAQEVGGVMVTLAALCDANGIDMHTAAETELARVWGKIEQIRAKEAPKMGTGPLAGQSAAATE